MKTMNEAVIQLLALCTVSHRSSNLNAVLFNILLPFLWSLKPITLLFQFTCFSQHKLICYFHHILCNAGRFLGCGKRDFDYLKFTVELHSRDCLLYSDVVAKFKKIIVGELLSSEKGEELIWKFFFWAMRNVIFKGYFCVCAA